MDTTSGQSSHTENFPKLGVSALNKPMHYSVGAVIRREGLYLLVDRMKEPLGYAGIAGHVDENEDDITALLREVREESGLVVVSHRLLYDEEVFSNRCRRGIDVHHWKLYACEAKGAARRKPDEARSIGWYTRGALKTLKLEPVWEYWFRKMEII